MKRAHLLTLCAAETQDTVCALVQQKQPSQVTFDEIVQLWKAYFDPTSSEIYCRSRFQSHNQKVGEIIIAYAKALKKLAADCYFGTSAERATSSTLLPLKGTLRDRFVCGVWSEEVQQRLFAEKELKLIEAYDFAIRAESAIQQQQKVKSDHSEVNKATASTGSRSSFNKR